MAPILRQLYFDIARGLAPDIALVCRVVERVRADDLIVLAEATSDELAFVPLLRVCIGTPAEPKMMELAQDQLDRLGLDILRPGDVINTPPVGQRAIARVFA